MKTETIATLENLQQVNWFCCVGKKDTQSVIVLDSWERAIEHCNSNEWENLCLEAVNQFCEHLAKRNSQRFSLWNEIVEEVKIVTDDLVSKKIRNTIIENKLPKIFEDTVRWDILHLAMEAEYSDIYPPGYYASQGYWYLKGHFPCGWQGIFPKGKLIVY